MNWCNTNRETKLNRNDCCCHHRKNETIFHVNKWIVWLLPKSLTQPSHLSFFFILTWREKRRNEVGWPREKGKFFLLFFKIIFGGRYWNVRKLSALPVVDEAVFLVYPHTPPSAAAFCSICMDVKPLLFSFFGRKTNLLFLCWLWENVLVFLTLWEKKGKKRRRHWGINFLFPNHENGASAVVSDFSMSLALHTNRLSRSLMNELLFLPSSLL